MKNSIIKQFYPYLKKYKLFLFLAVFSSILTSTLGTLGTYSIGKAVTAVDHIKTDGPAELIRILFLLAGIYISVAIFQFILSRSANRVAYASVRDLRNEIFVKLNKLSVSYFDNNAHGDIISRFTNDLDSVSEALALAINSVLSGVVLVVTSLIVMMFLSVKITLVILVFTPVTFIVAFIVSKATHETFAKQQRVVGELSAYISENVGNEKIIKSLGYEEKSKSRFEEINKKSYVTSKKAQFSSALVNPTARFVDHLCYISIGLVGAIMVIDGKLDVGIIASFLIYSTQFAKPFNEISSISIQIQTAIASLERIFSVMDEEEEVDSSDSKNIKLLHELSNIKGNVEFKNVAFSYDKKRPLIRDFSFGAKSGNLIAIVGPTGSGKTTLVNLLMRFYDIDSGKISLEETNIKDIERNVLRKNFGMVLQDTWLFSGTVAENIAYARPEATREEIIAAAKASYAHSFIKHLENGYDTIMSEDGGELSSGQKQLLTIARVMLMDPPMLILDEATSSIDTLTEIRIQKALNKMMTGRTSFVIAHRLSTIVSADCILVMNNGDIIEKGTHEELLKKGGFYSELYYSQFE